MVSNPLYGRMALLPSPATVPTAYFPVPAVAYTSAPGGMAVGKFPSPRHVLRTNSVNFAGSNKEAQEFLSRGGQVIIRMRGLPYDCTAKQVVSQLCCMNAVVVNVVLRFWYTL